MPSSQPISSAEIIGDKNCIYCGQSLRGISSQDKCPNCGKPAGYSLLGDHLRDAESTWTKAVVLGIDIAMGAFGVLALIFAAGVGVGPVVMAQTTELGMQTGLLIGGVALEVAGYEADAAMSAEVADRLRLEFALGPVVLAAAALIVLGRFPISRGARLDALHRSDTC